jgi:hypothetical protein
MPSVVYKVRMLLIQEDWISERTPTVMGVNTEVQK